MLPRTDEDEDENEEGTDESIINVSLDDSSVESVEQRNDMDNAATPASDSNPGEHNPFGEPAPIEITDPPTVVRDLYDDEKLVIDDFERHAAFCSICSHTIQRYEDGLTLCGPGNIRARILRRYLYSQNGKYFSTVDFENGKSTRVKLPRGAFATRGLLTVLEQGMPIREKAKQTSHAFSRRGVKLEPEGDHDRTDPRDSDESQLLREEEESSEDETSERLRKPQQFDRTHQSTEELKAEEEEVRRQLEADGLSIILTQDEERQREKLVREARWKELARQQEGEEEEEKKKLIREEKWKELARQKEEEEEHEQLIQKIRDKDMRKAREAEEKREREDALKNAAIEEWKLEQVRIKQRETESQSKEFRERLHGMGYTDEEIEQIIHKKEKDQKKEQKEEKNKEPEVKDPNTTWIKV